MVVGRGFKKFLGHGSSTYSFLKILALNLDVIQPEEEIRLATQGYLGYRERNREDEDLGMQRVRRVAPKFNLTSPSEQV